MFRIAGMPEPEVQGGHSPVLADYLNQDEQIMPNTLLLTSPNFQTFRHPWNAYNVARLVAAL